MEQNSTIQKATKSTNLTAVITAAIAILLLALLVAFSAKPLYNHFAGPFEVSSEELIAYQGPEDTFRTHVTTHPNVALDTNFYYYEKMDNGSEFVKYSYYALLFDERLLLAKYPGSGRGDIAQPGVVAGKIIKMTDDENTQVLQALTDEFPNLEDVFLPYLLDTTVDNSSVWLSILGIAILVAISIWSLVRLIRRSGYSSRHPIARDLARYGDWQQLAREIDAQMAEPHETHGNDFHLTRDWLIYQTRIRFVAVPFRDMIWNYMFQVTHRSYGIVTGRTYSVMVNDRYGKTKNLPYGTDSHIVMDLLKKLQVCAPWAYTGYSPELQHAWDQERDQIIASVDARKQVLDNYLANAEPAPTDMDSLIENESLEPDPFQALEQDETADVTEPKHPQE